MTPALELGACLAGGWGTSPEQWARGLIGGSLLMVISAVGGQRFFPGRTAFVGLLAAMLWWVFNTSLERAALDPVCKSSLALMNWTVIPLVPMLWSLFIHQYVHSDPSPAPLRWRLMFGGVWLVMVVVVLSNPHHQLLYGPNSGVIGRDEGVLRMRYERGPLYWLVAVWAYALILRSAALVLRTWRAGSGGSGGDGRHWLGFLVVSLVPMAANVAYLTTPWRIYGSDPTPLSFAVTGLGLAWLIQRNRLFDVVPMARQLLFTELADPVLILDAEQRVMEANAAALQLAVERPALGLPLAQWPRIGPALVARLADANHRAPLQLSAPEAFYDLQVRPLGQGRQRIGLLVQLHDVTAREHERRQVQQHLAARDAEHLALREQALRDPLTGLWNRRALEARFAAERETHAASGQALALVLLDLDHFKRINDRHGHAVGDAVLREVGAELRAAVRSADAVFRIGGEEFALLLAGADALQALRRTAGLREQIARGRFGGLDEPVTFSAGVVATPDHGVELGTLLAAADAALYEAKAQGRNRSLLAPAPPPAAPGA